jgi:hypothetical protein
MNVIEKVMLKKGNASGASDSPPAAIDVVGKLGATGCEVVSEVVGGASNIDRRSQPLALSLP